MPGSGKSTLGRHLANRYDLHFVDTDELIERRFCCSIQQLLNRYGMRYIQTIEQQTLCALQLSGHVIATGGSAVYSQLGMEHLQALGKIIYLKISLPTLLQRVDNVGSRGMVKPTHFGLPNVYRERAPLYSQWAQITIDNNQPLTAWRLDETCDRVLSEYFN